MVSALVLIGIALARPMVSVLLFDWTGDAALVEAGEMTVDRLELTDPAVRIVLPMVGYLCCPRGPWAFSTAIAGFSSPTLPRWCGMLPSLRDLWSVREQWEAGSQRVTLTR